MPTNRSLTSRRNPRGRFKSVQQIVGQNNPRTGAPNPKGQNPEGTERSQSGDGAVTMGARQTP